MKSNYLTSGQKHRKYLRDAERVRQRRRIDPTFRKYLAEQSLAWYHKNADIIKIRRVLGVSIKEARRIYFGQ